MNWLRLWHDVTSDVKLRKLQPAQKWAFIVLLVEASKSSKRGTIDYDHDDLADLCEMERGEFDVLLQHLVSRRIVTVDGDNAITFTNWEERQPYHDTSRERVRRHRESKGLTATCNGDVTLHERYSNGGNALRNGIDTDTDTEKRREEDVDSVGALSRTRARFVAPSVEEVKAYMTERKADASQAERFHDHYTANGWRVGRNPMKDWRAAVRNWIKSEPQYAPTSPTNARGGVFRGAPIPAVGSNLWTPPERPESMTPEQAEEHRRKLEEKLGQSLNVKLGSNT